MPCRQSSIGLSQVLKWDHYGITLSQAHNMCKPGLDPINCMSSLFFLMKIAESEQSGCLTVEWPHFYITKYKIILLHVLHAGQ